MTAWSTLSFTVDKTRARRDTCCPYLKIKLTKLSLKILLDKFPAPHFIKHCKFLHISFYTYTTLRLFFYLCAKSIAIANKPVSFANEQLPIVLNQLAILYSILIGQNNNFCQNFDQTTTPLESVWKLVRKTYFWPYCSKRAVASVQKANCGKMESQIPKYDHI